MTFAAIRSLGIALVLVAGACLYPARSLAGQTPRAGSDTGATVTVGGFIDTFYAWDVNRPASFDRAFTTQAARHDEFNVNLAYAELKLSGPRVRGRLALQAGTAVQANYAGEPTNGSVSGPTVSRILQEATAGFQVAPTLWLDAGIYFSHIGQESWISRDNPTYTRSLIAEYTPYYETGVHATWQPSPRWTAQLHVLNGWQNISETNSDKAIGLRVDYVASPHVTIGYANFVGNELPDSVPSRVRLFNEVLGQVTAGRASVWFTGDVGSQARAGGGTSTWYGGALIGRLAASPTVSLAARLERYVDPDGVIVPTGTANGFRVSGASLGLNVTPAPNVLWRIEVRGVRSRDPVFPKRSGGASSGDAFAVSSLALTL
jgi:hypothetical protein